MQPDVTVSTWNDALTHPWVDYGGRVANALQGAGTSLSNMVNDVATLVDSSGTRAPSQGVHGPQREGHNFQFRGTDAIGNPFNLVSYLMGNGGGSAEPDSIPIPTAQQLMLFFGDAPRQIAEQWASIPAEYGSQTDFAAAGMSSAAGMLGQGSDMMNMYQGFSGSFTGGTGQVGQGTSTGGGTQNSPIGTGVGFEFLCPPGTPPFGLLFHSELDSWFWRGLVPLETLFPATWFPGVREVGLGLIQTWGSVWPRQGAVFQQHPAKVSAVLAQRAGDIISYGAQPHIYTPIALTPQGYRWFGFQGIRENDPVQTIWQRVYPLPQPACTAFGVNDSLSLVGFGDGVTEPQQGFIWNAWRRQECCQAPAGYVYIGSVGMGG